MSKTLFWYVFRDLLRIFMLASGALAGIMSFGGLLRPLTEHGLDAGQVGKMLTYFTPAMTTYSFPVAALFATTIVYGRLSADNELTAARASGISFLSMTTPALVLGLSVALVSLLFLCFVVPTFTLRVEKVIYSNLAQVVQNQIERTHQLKLQEVNIFAQSARVLEPDPANPKVQRVELTGPMITNFVRIGDAKMPVVLATDFKVAKRATAFIDARGGSRVFVTIGLENGSRFARDIKTGFQGSTKFSQIGPVPFPSPIKEEAKFMTISQLKYLLENPETSSRLRDQLHDLIRVEQQGTYLEDLRNRLATAGTVRLDGVMPIENAEVPKAIVLTRGDGPVVVERPERGGELVLRSKPLQNAREVKAQIVDLASGAVEATHEAVEMRLKCDPRWQMPGSEGDGSPPSPPTIELTIDTYDALTVTEEEQAAHRKFSLRPLDIPMPAKLAAMQSYSVGHYLHSATIGRSERDTLEKARTKLTSKLQSEIHSRAAFAISCLVLVMVGCVMGMTFRSGNFLSAFAVSFVPAMLCIALIVTGQQVATNPGASSLTQGLMFIWSGNVIVLLLALGMLWRLQRQ